MQITSKNIKLKLESGFDNESIEQVLRQRGLDPLRWAIVAVNGDNVTISVAVVDL